MHAGLYQVDNMGFKCSNPVLYTTRRLKRTCCCLGTFYRPSLPHPSHYRPFSSPHTTFPSPHTAFLSSHTTLPSPHTTFPPPHTALSSPHAASISPHAAFPSLPIMLPSLPLLSFFPLPSCLPPPKPPSVCTPTEISGQSLRAVITCCFIVPHFVQCFGVSRPEMGIQQSPPLLHKSPNQTQVQNPIPSSQTHPSSIPILLASPFLALLPFRAHSPTTPLPPPLSLPSPFPPLPPLSTSPPSSLSAPPFSPSLSPPINISVSEATGCICKYNIKYETPQSFFPCPPYISLPFTPFPP
uniref:Uncharacterized protein n=1 Tax=Eptatretus burgeri TaxID=7764 RepID=A0A8C4N6C3_EPTBU